MQAGGTILLTDTGTSIRSQGIARVATAVKATNSVGTVVFTSTIVSGTLINICMKQIFIN